MAKINTSRYLNTKEMNYDKATHTFSEEASTLRFGGPYRLYDDAVDYGVWVTSHKTGKTIGFVCVEEKRDNDGDVQFWKFRFDSGTPTLHLTIFND